MAMSAEAVSRTASQHHDDGGGPAGAGRASARVGERAKKMNRCRRPPTIAPEQIPWLAQEPQAGTRGRFLAFGR